MRSALWLIVLLAAVAVVSACNGDGKSSTATPTGGDTPAAETSPSPGVAITPSPAPQAPVPDVDPSLEVLDLGEISLSLEAGQTYGFEAQNLAATDAPPCAAFVFLFGWQVQDPYPPDDVSFAITSTRMEETETLGEEPSGTATIGCAFIEARNDSAFAITVQLRYAIAQQTE